MHINAYIETVGQDLRYAWRGFLRNPAFTLTALLAIALGIGMTTAVFSVVDLILFRSLPYPSGDRLVSVGIVAAPLQPEEFLFGGTYLEWRDQQTPFEAFTSWSGTSDCDLTENSPLQLSCAQVEATFLSTLGVRPLIGRDFKREEDTFRRDPSVDAPKAAILSYGLWKSRFNADRSIVDRTISLDGQPIRVIGVLPPAFELPTLERADILVPQGLREVGPRSPVSPGRVVWAFGRLKPGINVAAAQEQLRPLMDRFFKFVPPNFQKETRILVRTLRDRQVHDAQIASWVLFGSVIAVLLIACVNVANLLLARAASRRNELALRSALGAGRMRLTRQSLTESVLLSAIGGTAGCGLAYGFLRLFVSIAPQGITRLQQAHLDQRVLLFAFGSSILCGLLFGIIPALQNPESAELGGSRAIGAPRQHLRQILIVAQIGISLVLLTGATLLLRTLWNLQNVPLGIQTENVVSADIVLGSQRYAEPAAQLAFFDQLENKLRESPDVRRVAVTDVLPPGIPSGSERTQPLSAIEVEGRPLRTGGTGGTIVWRYVSPEYFSALEIPITRGREFQETDRNSSDNSVILSDALARSLFVGEDPLGRRMRIGDGPWQTVVGVAGNVKNTGITDLNDPEYYMVRKHAPDPVFLGMLSNNRRRGSVIVRTSRSVPAISNSIRTAIAAIDPTLPVTVEAMAQRARGMTDRPRFNALLLAMFAGVGLVLAAIGLYGVIAFLVAQRTQEIGVRMAIGATPGEISKLVLSGAARWTMAGVVLGLAGAIATTHLLRGLLFQVPERDPWSLAASVLILTAVAFAAAWLPSRRAARIDPLQSLRRD